MNEIKKDRWSNCLINISADKPDDRKDVKPELSPGNKKIGAGNEPDNDIRKYASRTRHSYCYHGSCSLE